MRVILITLLHLLLFNYATSQITFSNFDFNLNGVAGKNVTDIFCTGTSFSIKFQLNGGSIEHQDNFLLVDSQVIQIASLTVNGAKKDLTSLTVSEQKQLLSDYSKYEMDYFSNDQKIEVINPENQWVAIKFKHWLIWYFRVGNLSIKVEGKTEIQLFASTIIGNKIVDLNAPIQQNGNFEKAALIVNQMMESLIINPKN